MSEVRAHYPIPYTHFDVKPNKKRVIELGTTRNTLLKILHEIENSSIISLDLIINAYASLVSPLCFVLSKDGFPGWIL